MTDRVVSADAPVTPAPAPAADVNIAVSQAPAAGPASAGGSRFKVEATPVSAAPAGEQRPTWLPEKFKSPEDLAQAYSQLEQRLGQLSHMPAAPAAPAMSVAPAAPTGQPAPAQTPPPQPAPQAGAGDLVARMTQEYAASGQVSAQLRQEFQQRTGLPESFIDQQVAYLRHQGSQAQSLAVQRLGGEAAVKELTEWARTKLSPEDRAAFNRLVYSGDEAAARIAIDGLAAKYESEVGRSPKIIAGRRPQSDYGGIVPFQSDQEFLAAQKDPRYKTDPGYRDQVFDRLRVAQKLGLIR